MSNSLIVVDSDSHAVPKNSRLAKSERELADAMIAEYEAFYKQGVILDRIKRDREFVDANFGTFREYMDTRMPVGIKGRFADKLIAAKNVRPLLPEIQDGPNGPNPWTEGAVRPLTHKDFTPSDVKRLGKKIATQVKKGEPLTEKLVKSICDEDRGIEKKKFKKKSAEIAAADTPAQTIERMTVEVNLWLKSLGMVPSDFWEDAEEDEPGCVKSLISSLSEFANFLRG